MKLIAALLFLGSGSLGAHECWLQPSDYAPASGRPVSLEIKVGMDFAGETRPFTRQRVERLLHFSSAGRQDSTALVPAGGTEDSGLAILLDTPGGHLLAYDSVTNLITLDAAEFTAYLHEEGLEQAIAWRKEKGQSARPGRERYRRCAKTLLQCGAVADSTHATQTGQMIELIPLDNPATLHPGAKLRFRLLFRQQPLADTLVQAWHRHGEQNTKLQARTTKQGDVEFTLAAAGPWMISAVQMMAAGDTAEADWESYWGSLTFCLPP